MIFGFPMDQRKGDEYHKLYGMESVGNDFYLERNEVTKRSIFKQRAVDTPSRLLAESWLYTFKIFSPVFFTVFDNSILIFVL